jgi:hypothetical protein
LTNGKQKTKNTTMSEEFQNAIEQS